MNPCKIKISNFCSAGIIVVLACMGYYTTPVITMLGRVQYIRYRNCNMLWHYSRSVLQQKCVTVLSVSSETRGVEYDIASPS